MSAITTHILDLSRGRPAPDVLVALEMQESTGEWKELGSDRTDEDGRAAHLLPEGAEPAAGIYRLRFRTGPYFRTLDVEAFYPFVEIAFRLSRPGEHYHVPLLLGPFGYTTYRGS